MTLLRVKMERLHGGPISHEHGFESRTRYLLLRIPFLLQNRMTRSLQFTSIERSDRNVSHRK